MKRYTMELVDPFMLRIARVWAGTENGKYKESVEYVGSEEYVKANDVADLEQRYLEAVKLLRRHAAGPIDEHSDTLDADTDAFLVETEKPTVE